MILYELLLTIHKDVFNFMFFINQNVEISYKINTKWF